MPGLLLDTLRGANGVRAAGLADAPGRALPARISRAAGREGRLPRAGLRQRRRGRDHAPADPPLRLRRRDPVLRHPDRAPRAGPGSGVRGRRRPAAVAAAGRCARWQRLRAVPERLEPIYETVEKVRGRLWRRDAPCWALPAAPGRSRPTWSRARAAATSTRRARSPIAIRRRSRRSSTRSST